MAHFIRRGLEPAAPRSTSHASVPASTFIEIGRRNLVAPEAMPYRNPLSFGYDSGPASAVEKPLRQVFGRSPPRFC
jgi:hypothetical protein